MEWLDSEGYKLWLPVGHSRNVDLLAEDDDEQVVRVQVKTTSLHRRGRWLVSVCARGGNRSWNGIVKRFSAKRCDWLFVLIADGRRWFIPAGAVEGGTALSLGGPE
jgi:hypothetical protein